MGNEAAYWEGVGRIPPQGGPQYESEDTLEREGGSVDIPPEGGRDDGRGNFRRWRHTSTAAITQLNSSFRTGPL